MRYLSEHILEDLEEKMVFLGGPRQVGKTTLCQEILKENFSSGRYYNWDNREERLRIESQKFSKEDKLLVFDELHKFPHWKNYIKGLYDSQKNNHTFLVTGSARLDLYQKGGDSLLGRYHYYRLHPFSVAEMLGNIFDIAKFLKEKKLCFTQAHKTQKKGQKNLENLLEKGGFPEPLLGENKRTQLRWSTERKQRLVQEDIRDVSVIKMISDLEKLVFLLPDRVGSLFSLRSLQEDLSVSVPTISQWMEILENFYYIFRITPYFSTKVASLKKEPKVFLWDYSEIQEKGARFENLVGSHLLKWVHFLQDTYGVNIHLQYLRDKSQREVDFLIVLDNKPFMAIEVRLSDTKISKHLQYFSSRMDIPFSFQIVETEDVDFEKNGIQVMSAGKFLGALV